MYQTSVPLVRFFERQEENIAEAKRLGASRVFLCVGRGLAGEAENRAELDRLAENIPVYEAAGFEVGVWIPTIGHGGPLAGDCGGAFRGGFTNIVGLKGVSAGDSFCPLDPAFSAAICARVRGIAEAGAKMIMIDDDFRLSTRGDCGCTCERHLAEYRRRLGENLAREEILTKAFSGGANRYRDVWYDLMGDTLRGFARQMREAVDSVDPSVRLGACSCMTVWDADGVDSIELARILAGTTKPFLRLIGAAYWPASWGPPCQHLQYVAELERMQRRWCEGEGIEIFGEGDVYPRPRHFVPAAYLEAFDTILRADGGFDGILKYGVDYCSSPRYETGYADRAERSAPLYAAIEKHFSGKRSAGAGVACAMKKIRAKVFSDPAKEIGGSYDDGFFQPEQLLLTDNSIPMTYGEAPVTAAFGENAKYLGNLPGGLLLDAPAALALERLGVDTGLAAAEPYSPAAVSGEYYFEERETVYLADATGLMKLSPKRGAAVLSEFRGETAAPSALQYENAQGTRFCILGFDAEKSKRNARFSRNYCRQSQLVRCLEWLGRARLPAVCAKNPDLYLLCKRGGGSMAVGLWNLFPDAVLSPVIALDKAYSRAEFINCSGSLDGDRVRLDADIPAYGFAGFEVFE